MRIRALSVLAALLLVPAAGARAQSQEEKPATDLNVSSIDFGGQLSTTTGDEGRYQRYRDLRSGGLLDRFKYQWDRDNWNLDLLANHVGYRDQRFVVKYHRYGRVRFNFMWDQTPLFYGPEDRDQFGLLDATPYAGVGTGEYRLDDGVQAALQAICPAPPCAGPVNANRQAALYGFTTRQAGALDIKQRRDTALVDAAITVLKDTDLLLHFQNWSKEGTQPWNASFGFSAALELPGPVDYRTTDFGAALQWANTNGMVKVGYDGSWFHNSISTLVWDNPLRLTDTTYGSAYSPGDGTSQGRQDLWPDSTTNMVSGTAMYKLPHRSRVYGNLGYSKWDQNDQLLPFTINTAIEPIPLPRQTAQAKADVTSALVGFTSRPVDKLWLNLRYKLYDFQNKTPEFPVHEYVRFDQVVEELFTGPCVSDPSKPCGTEAFSYKRQYFDADASYSIVPFTALRLGYSRESDDRTFRQFEKTADNIVRVAVDTTGWKYAMLRAQYDYAKRTGTGLDEEVFDAENEGFALPRQFDISDRTRKRFSFMGSVTPADIVSIDAQIGVFREDRPDAQFGLLNSDGDFYSIGVDVTPVQKLAFGVTYGKDKYTTMQMSRQANPGVQQTDLSRNWSTDYSDDVNSIYAYVDLLQVLPKTDVRYAFDWMDGLNDITYGLQPNQTIFTTVPLVQLPNASHTTTRSMLDVMYRFNRRIGFGLGWFYDDYSVNDWAWNDCGSVCQGGTPGVSPTPTTTVNGLALNPPGQAGTSAQFLALTRYMYRPYTGNTVYLRLRYFF